MKALEVRCLRERYYPEVGTFFPDTVDLFVNSQHLRVPYSQGFVVDDSHPTSHNTRIVDKCPNSEMLARFLDQRYSVEDEGNSINEQQDMYDQVSEKVPFRLWNQQRHVRSGGNRRIFFVVVVAFMAIIAFGLRLFKTESVSLLTRHLSIS